jgi:hypothetical protein
MGLRADVKLDVIVNLASDVGRFFAREMEGRVYRVGRITEEPARV